MSLAATLWRIAPPWLKRTNAAKLWRVLGSAMDVELQNMREALDARFPGRGTKTANPFIGADRLIDRGRFDTDAGYESTLRAAFDLHAVSGSWYAVGNAVQRFWGPYKFDADGSPVYVEVEIVNDLGTRWDMFDRKGEWSTHRPTVRNWNWDGISGRPNRFWVIIRALDVVDVVNEDAWSIGDGTIVGDGHYIGGINGELVADLRRTIKKWKSAKGLCEGIIFVHPLTDSPADQLHWSNPITGAGNYMPNGDWDDPTLRNPAATYFAGVR